MLLLLPLLLLLLLPFSGRHFALWHAVAVLSLLSVFCAHLDLCTLCLVQPCSELNMLQVTCIIQGRAGTLCICVVLIGSSGIGPHPLLIASNPILKPHCTAAWCQCSVCELHCIMASCSRERPLDPAVCISRIWTTTCRHSCHM